MPTHLEPGPDHPITVAPESRRVRVSWKGEVVAETTSALRLQEASYPPVFYIPREDARMELYEPTQSSTHCPYKGDASYFTLRNGSEKDSDAVWSYEAPYPAVKSIAGHLAFYPNKVSIEVADA